MKKVLFLISLSVFLFSFFSYSYADWAPFSSKAKIPLPRGSIRINSEKTSLSGEEFSTSFYTSELSAEKVRSFYKSALSRKGWQEINLSGQDRSYQQGQAPGLDFLAFLKEGKMINITFLPTSAFRGKTTFSIAEGKMPSSQSFLKGEFPKKLDSMPLYPGAEQISYTGRDDGGFNAGYKTPDEINTVLDFYRQNMPDYGWVLQREIPIENQDLDFSSIEERSPSLKDKLDAVKGKISGSMLRGGLQFSNEEGDICIIGVISGMTQPPQTLITTGYVKKK